MTPVSVADVIGMARRYARAAREVGILARDDTLRVNHGSKLNGNAWEVSASSHPYSLAPGLAPLGRTRREAYDRLHAAAVALEAVAYVKGDR